MSSRGHSASRVLERTFAHPLTMPVIADQEGVGKEVAKRPLDKSCDLSSGLDGEDCPGVATSGFRCGR